MIRPGVPTMTWTPRRSADSCNAVTLTAVHRQDMQALDVRGIALEASETCRASSRVGRQHERLRGGGRETSIRDRIGSAKAAVLPVPVWARPTTWRFSSRSGMVSAWMGDGLS